MEHVFVDTNIVIDLLQKRENFYKEAQELFTKADRKKLKLYISALTFANTYYILSKYYSSSEAKKILSKFKVLVEVLPTTDKIIDLALASDFNDFEENWNDLSDTLSLIGEIVSDNQQEKLYINNISGNAGRLLGRFCSEKSTIKDFVIQISDKEQELNPEKILAEIIHLPESRIGNVIRRPQLRSYEIPYLANSALNKENQISVDDLYLSIKNGKLFLRSKKHNKEVIPHLTNAHNYSNNSLPIYHFLCDYSNQKIRTSLFLDWGGLSKIYDFLPRVEYENIILSKAQWKINSEQIKIFNSIILSENVEHLFQKIEEWRKLKQIPQWIQWVQGDNTLAVNLQNFDLVQMFFSSVKNEKEIIIEEFLINDKSDYVHQFVFSLYKDL